MEYLGSQTEFSIISFIDTQGRNTPEFYTWGHLQFKVLGEKKSIITECPLFLLDSLENCGPENLKVPKTTQLVREWLLN